jgi:hypothetical protein
MVLALWRPLSSTRKTNDSHISRKKKKWTATIITNYNAIKTKLFTNKHYNSIGQLNANANNKLAVV